MNQRIAALAPPSDPSTIEQISETVVSPVADASGRSPLDLEPLATVIDPDALESFVASADTHPDQPSATVEFPYNGYTVTVDDDGDVTVEG